MTLSRAVGRGMLWSALESFGSTGASFVLSVIMARFLSPQAFGLVAVLQIFVAVARVFVDSGMTEALIRRAHGTALAYSTAFVLNVSAGVVAYVALWFLADPVARFYGNPILADIMRIMCIGIPLNALCVVQTARLVSAMRFDRLFKVSGTAVIISGAVGILMAVKGFGVWALVWQQVAMWGVRALLLWVLVPGFGRLRFCRKEAGALMSFSWKVMLSALIDTVWSHLNVLVIGKFFNPAQTGLYWRAQSFAILPASVATGVIMRVAMPMFSRAGCRPERLRVMFGRVLGMSVWVLFPVMALLCALSTPVFALLFNEEWSGAVPMFRIICIAGMLYPLHALNLCLLNVVGRSDLFLRLEVIKKLLAVLMLCIAVPHGVMAVCWGLLIVSVVSLVVNTWYSGGYALFSIFGQIKLVCAPFIMSLISGVVARIIALLFPEDSVFGLLISIAAGILLYLSLSHLLRLPWGARIAALKI